MSKNKKRCKHSFKKVKTFTKPDPGIISKRYGFMSGGDTKCCGKRMLRHKLVKKLKCEHCGKEKTKNKHQEIGVCEICGRKIKLEHFCSGY